MKLLIVIDMQKDFINCALGTKEAQEILPAVQSKIAEYKRNNDPIIFTRDTHEANYLQTQEGYKLPVEHCIKGTPGWEIDPALDTKDAIIFDKPSFGSIELAEYVKQYYSNAQEIELIGLCTDICIISNAMILKATLPETKVTVDSKACAGVTPQSHNNAIEAMKMCQIDIK